MITAAPKLRQSQYCRPNDRLSRGRKPERAQEAITGQSRLHVSMIDTKTSSERPASVVALRDANRCRRFEFLPPTRTPDGSNPHRINLATLRA